MGSDKALLAYEGRTFLAGAIRLLQSCCDFALVVAGSNLELLKPVVYENSAYILENPHPERGQFSSLQLGLQAVLDRGRDAACVTLVDRPPANVSTLRKLMRAFMETVPEKIWAVVPEFEGKHGHPVLFAREVLEVFLRAAPSSNAREIEHQFQNRILYVSVDDPRATMNINTPDDYSALSGTKA